MKYLFYLLAVMVILNCSDNSNQPKSDNSNQPKLDNSNQPLFDNIMFYDSKKTVSEKIREKRNLVDIYGIGVYYTNIANITYSAWGLYYKDQLYGFVFSTEELLPARSWSLIKDNWEELIYFLEEHYGEIKRRGFPSLSAIPIHDKIETHKWTLNDRDITIYIAHSGENLYSVGYTIKNRKLAKAKAAEEERK